MVYTTYKGSENDKYALHIDVSTLNNTTNKKRDELEHGTKTNTNLIETAPCLHKLSVGSKPGLSNTIQ